MANTCINGRETYYQSLYCRLLERLSTEVARRTALEDRVTQLLTEIEWTGDFCDDPACPDCLMPAWRKKHSAKCRLSRLLTECHGPKTVDVRRGPKSPRAGGEKTLDDRRGPKTIDVRRGPKADGVIDND